VAPAHRYPYRPERDPSLAGQIESPELSSTSGTSGAIHRHKQELILAESAAEPSESGEASPATGTINDPDPQAPKDESL